MKKIYKISIALCLSLAILFLTMGPAAAEDYIEIRGPDYGSAISEIIADEDGSIRIDATQFADFYYNIDDGVITETLTLK